MQRHALQLIALLVLLTFPVCAFAVNGMLYDDNGQRVLHVWGDNYEMGYAHGYFLGPEIMAMMTVYTFPPEGAGPWLYRWARWFITTHFYFEPELLDELQGMYDGMIDAGVDPYVEVLERDFDRDDLLTLFGLADLNSLFCATVIGFDSVTDDVPELNGALVVAHNTDYAKEEEDPWLAGKSSIIIAYTPDDPNQMPFVSLSFAGSPGVVAGMNAAGIGVVINKGRYIIPVEEMNLDPLPEPGPWLARKALATRDFNGDQEDTIDDYFDYFVGVNHFSASIYQVFGPSDRSDPPTAALEINNETRAMRYVEDDANLAPDVLVTLNYEYMLMPAPQPGDAAYERLAKATQLINEEYARSLSFVNLWDYLEQLQLDSDIFTSQQSSIMAPDTMRLALKTADDSGPAPLQTEYWHDFADLFAMPPVDDDTTDDDTTDDDTTDDDTTDDDTIDDDEADDDDDEADDDDDDDDDDDGCGC
ncbi:MAG TPA: hypothetical protein PKW95_07780 [bacterium]|nr:hypothetical protein [bacterium]